MPTIDALRSETQHPVIIVNHSGIVEYVNPAFENAYGWKATEIVGELLTEIIPKSLRDAHTLGISKFMITAKPTILNQPLRLKIMTGEGEEVDAEHFIVAMQKNSKWVFGATIKPIPV